MKILDGGFGTTLRDYFHNTDTTIWSLRPLINGNKDVYYKCHKLFTDIGCHIITTSNYCATPYYFKKANLDVCEIDKCIRTCGEIAYSFKEKDSKLSIAGSVPPYGESYCPNIAIDDKHLEEHYNQTFSNLKHFIDFYLAETISSLREAKLIVNTFQKGDYDKPLYLSFCIKEDGVTLLDGNNIYSFLDDIFVNDNPYMNVIVHGIMFNCSPCKNIDNALKILSSYRHVM